MAGVLAAAIAVVDQIGRRLSGADRLMQGLENERFAHLLGQVPTDDAAGEQIHEQSQVGEGACPQRNVGDVGDPNLVGAIGRRRRRPKRFGL